MEVTYLFLQNLRGCLGKPALFGSFSGTMSVSDFSVAYAQGVWPQTFPYRSGVCPPKTSEISRFSSIERPRMHRVFDSVGPVHDSSFNVIHRFAFPSNQRGRHPRIGDFGAQWLAYASPVNYFTCTLAATRT